MKKILLSICAISTLTSSSPVHAQDVWPGVPSFVVKSGYTKREAGLAKEYKEFIKFVGRTPQWPHPFATKFLEGKAFQLGKPGGVKGTVAMSSFASDGKNEFSIVSLKKVDGDKVDEAFYEVSGTSLHSPLLSPDGNYLVLREGLPPDDHGVGFHLHVWDLAKGEVWFPSRYTGGDGYLMFPKVVWSPGGRFLSYLRGGDTLGSPFDSLGRPYEPYYTLYVCDLKTRLNYPIAKNSSVWWTFTSDGNMLYSIVPAEKCEQVNQRRTRASIYSSAIAQGEPKRIIDGGAYGQESPDGKWIAFCDWPGEISDSKEVTPEVLNSTKKGLFFYHKPTGKRIFALDMQLEPYQQPIIQWGNDGKNVYIVENVSGEGEATGLVTKVQVGDDPSVKPIVKDLAKLVVKIGQNELAGFVWKGLSPDGKRFYMNANQSNLARRTVQSTLTAVDTESGNQTVIARVTNVANENPDWDWRDASEPSQNIVTSRIKEENLAISRKANTDVDPAMQLPAG